MAAGTCSRPGSLPRGENRTAVRPTLALAQQVLCQSLVSYLVNQKSYDDEGWLMLAGKSYPGYARYPYVHASTGQVPSVQPHQKTISSPRYLSQFLLT